MAFEKEQSVDILIEWDQPKPARTLTFREKEKVWYKRLNPLRKQPGRRARIIRGVAKSIQANGAKTNIKRSCYTHNPRERWKFEIAKDDDGTYGIWATYWGVMSEEEFDQSEQERKIIGDRIKAQKRAKRIRDAQKLERSRLSSSLRPPVYRGE